MTYYEFRAEKTGHGFAGYIEADTVDDALTALADLGFAGPTYLALVTTPEAGVPVYTT